MTWNMTQEKAMPEKVDMHTTPLHLRSHVKQMPDCLPDLA